MASRWCSSVSSSRSKRLGVKEAQVWPLRRHVRGMLLVVRCGFCGIDGVIGVVVCCGFDL